MGYDGRFGLEARAKLVFKLIRSALHLWRPADRRPSRCVHDNPVVVVLKARAHMSMCLQVLCYQPKGGPIFIGFSVLVGINRSG